MYKEIKNSVGKERERVRQRETETDRDRQTGRDRQRGREGDLRPRPQMISHCAWVAIAMFTKECLMAGHSCCFCPTDCCKCSACIKFLSSATDTLP